MQKKQEKSRVLRAGNWIISIWAGLTLFCMMGLGLFDVTFRYVFNSPIPGAAEVSELLLGVMVFLALPLATGLREHVTVDLLPRNSNRLIGRLRIALIDIVSAAFVAIMAWQLTKQGLNQADYGDTSSFLNIPLAPITYLMAIATAISVVILLWQAFEALNGNESERVVPVK